MSQLILQLEDYDYQTHLIDDFIQSKGFEQ